MKKIKQDIVNFSMGGVMGLIVLLGMFIRFNQDRVLSGVKLLNEDVGGLNRQELVEKIERNINNYQLQVNLGETRLKVPSNLIKFEVENTVDEIMRVGKQSWLDWFTTIKLGKNINLQIKMENEVWDEYLTQLIKMVEIEGKPAVIERSWGKVKIINGKDGVKVDKKKLRDGLMNAAKSLSKKPVEIPVKKLNYRLTEQELAGLLERAKKISESEIILSLEDVKIKLVGDELISFLDTTPRLENKVNSENLLIYLEAIKARYDRPPQNAVFKFEDGIVKEFKPARDGWKIDLRKTIVQLQNEIEGLLATTDRKKVEIKVKILKTKPEITTKEVNDLGIVEVIGRGESYYAHSIPNRVYNVGLASSRVSGALIPPGKEFSFNRIVGDISRSTGYKSAYVISNGRTELGDGGGVCQVSTTVFRAALDAGLPITERWAHAYRVGYYEQNSKAGFDATIYSPSKDLKFLNDTSGYILIQTKIELPKRHLIVEIYGTKDDRRVNISPARVWGVTPPPPDLYQDEPSLPKGVIKQVDWSAWGAKAAFDYEVKRGDKILFSKTFKSSYKPWQNVFLRGTKE